MAMHRLLHDSRWNCLVEAHLGEPALGLDAMRRSPRSQPPLPG